jgi:hypothetical protein
LPDQTDSPEHLTQSGCLELAVGAGRELGPDNPTGGTENLPQIVGALRGALSHEGQVARNEGTFLVVHIARIRFSGFQVPNTLSA